MTTPADFIKILPRNEADTCRIPFVQLEATPEMKCRVKVNELPTGNGFNPKKSSRKPVPKKSAKKSPKSKMNLLPRLEENLMEAEEFVEESQKNPITAAGFLNSNGKSEGLETSIRSFPFLGIRTRSVSQSSNGICIDFGDQITQPEVTFIDGMKFLCHDLGDECQDSDINHLVNQYLDYNSDSEESNLPLVLPKKTDDIRKIKGSANKQRYKEDYEELYTPNDGHGYCSKQKRLKSYVYGAANVSENLELMVDPLDLIMGVQHHEIEDAFLLLSSAQRSFNQTNFDFHLAEVTNSSALSAAEALTNSIAAEVKTRPASKIAPPKRKQLDFPVISKMDALDAVEAFIKILTPTKNRKWKNRNFNNNNNEKPRSRPTKAGRITKVPARFQDRDFCVELPTLSPKRESSSVSGNIFSVMKKLIGRLDVNDCYNKEKVLPCETSADEHASKKNKRFVKIKLKNSFSRNCFVKLDFESNQKASSNVDYVMKNRNEPLCNWTETRSLESHDSLIRSSIGNTLTRCGIVADTHNFKERQRRATNRSLAEELSNVVGSRNKQSVASLKKTLDMASLLIKSLEKEMGEHLKAKEFLEAKNFLLTMHKRKLMEKLGVSDADVQPEPPVVDETTDQPNEPDRSCATEESNDDSPNLDFLMDKKTLLSNRLTAQLENLKRQKAALNMGSSPGDHTIPTKNTKQNTNSAKCKKSVKAGNREYSILKPRTIQKSSRSTVTKSTESSSTSDAVMQQTLPSSTDLTHTLQGCTDDVIAASHYPAGFVGDDAEPQLDLTPKILHFRSISEEEFLNT